MVLEHVYPVLQSMFSDLQPIIELTQRGERKIEHRSVKKLVGTLSVCCNNGHSVSTVCGCICTPFGPNAHSQECLSSESAVVDDRSGSGIVLPSIGAVLAAVSVQEPTLYARLQGLLSWRLSNLTPMGADVVLLLSRLIEASILDEGTQHL
jgi:hypothetical protein